MGFPMVQPSFRREQIGFFHLSFSNCVKDFIYDSLIYRSRAEHCEKLQMVLAQYDECGG